MTLIPNLLKSDASVRGLVNPDTVKFGTASEAADAAAAGPAGLCEPSHGLALNSRRMGLKCDVRRGRVHPPGPGLRRPSRC